MITLFYIVKKSNVTRNVWRIGEAMKKGISKKNIIVCSGLLILLAILIVSYQYQKYRANQLLAHLNNLSSEEINSITVDYQISYWSNHNIKKFIIKNL